MENLYQSPLLMKQQCLLNMFLPLNLTRRWSATPSPSTSRWTAWQPYCSSLASSPGCSDLKAPEVLCKFTLSYLFIQIILCSDFSFDEMHYGKYASLYLKNTFFFDSNPPLGKMLIAGAGYLAGFDGRFSFDKIGQEYGEGVPLWHLRFLPAFCGSLLTPTVYLIMTELGLSHYAGALAGFMVLFGNFTPFFYSHASIILACRYSSSCSVKVYSDGVYHDVLWHGQLALCPQV